MDKPTHWLLQSINHFLYYTDEAAREYPNLQSMKDEIQMWRKRYIHEHMSNDTTLTQDAFINLTSVNFNYFNVDEIANRCRDMVE